VPLWPPRLQAEADLDPDTEAHADVLEDTEAHAVGLDDRAAHAAADQPADQPADRTAHASAELGHRDTASATDHGERQRDCGPDRWCQHRWRRQHRR
jgi:hypothetical protein